MVSVPLEVPTALSGTASGATSIIRRSIGWSVVVDVVATGVARGATVVGTTLDSEGPVVDVATDNASTSVDISDAVAPGADAHDDTRNAVNTNASPTQPL